MRLYKPVYNIATAMNDPPDAGSGEYGGSSGRVCFSIGGVALLVQLLTGTNQPLLINTTNAVGACALDQESMAYVTLYSFIRFNRTTFSPHLNKHFTLD